MFRDVVKVHNGRVTALDHASFEIARGETVALLGPNGAGKSTAIDTMLGLRTQTSGQVRVLGMEPSDAAAAKTIGKALPSYHLAQLGWNAAAGRALGMTNVAALAAWTVALATGGDLEVAPGEHRRLIRPWEGMMSVCAAPTSYPRTARPRRPGRPAARQSREHR